ncbi:unnamed protein product, partial [Mesorhabditis spiculigera]
MQEYLGGNFGIVSSMGDLWREQRRLTVHILRDFGMGRNVMEERVMIEVDFLLERLQSLKSGIAMQNEFDVAVGSVINNILFSYRFDEAHMDEFILMKTSLRDLVKVVMNPTFLIAAMQPKLRGIPPFKGLFQKFYSARDALLNGIRGQIAEKRKVVNYDSEESDDFVEAYLKEWERKKGTDQEAFYFEQQLVAVVLDVWGAGMETTSNTLTWAVCYILNTPHVQPKMHEELDRVIGSERKIEWADRNALPYMNAVISETQRLANLLPNNLGRVTTADTVIEGYRIPAGQAISPQISCVLYNDEIFPEPYSFKPERFINSDGSYKKYDEFIPFSVGKRACPGEGLARIELFLFLANVFQRFKVSSDQKPSMEKIAGSVVTAHPYNCNMEVRHN